MQCIILTLLLLYTSQAAVIISPDLIIDNYIFYENITEHIYCQSSINVPGLTIQRPNQEPTTGDLQVIEENVRVVLKFDRIRASDAGDYICKGTATSPSNSLFIKLATVVVLTDNPYNQSTQITQQFLSTNNTYPQETSVVFTLGESHTFRCPSEANFFGTPNYIVLTRWFRDDCIVSNDSYHQSFHDGRLLVQIDPIPGVYVCEGYLPLPGYPRVVLMRATLSVISTPPPTTPAPSISPIVYALPIGAIVLLVISCVIISLFTLLMIFLIRRRSSLSSKTQTRVVKPTYIFRRSLEVSYKKIQFGAKLAEGSYGRFYQAKLEEDNVVVKRFEGDWGDKRTDVERDVLLRIENRKQITSLLGKTAGFVQVLGFCSKRVPYCIVYEDMNAGNLGNFLTQLRRGPVPQWYLSLLTNLWADKYAPRVSDDLLTISSQVTQAMKFLEQKRVLHRSLDTSKVLLLARPKSFVAKISGFSPEGEQAGSDVEKLHYRAPEVINGSPHSHKSDVYSLSLLLLRIVTVAGAGLDSHRMSQLKKLKVTQPANISDKLFAVFKDGLNQTPSERPSLSQLSEELDKLSADVPASSLIRLRLSEEIVPLKKSWQQWDEAILLAKPPLLKATDDSQEGYLIDNNPATSDKRMSKEILRNKKDSSLQRRISVGPMQPEVAGAESGVSLRLLRKDKKNIAGLM